MGVLLKLIIGMLGLFVLGFMAAQALRNARRLDRRIAQFKAEQEDMQAQGRVVHPYMALAGMGGEDEHAPQPRAKTKAAPRRRFALKKR